MPRKSFITLIQQKTKRISVEGGTIHLAGGFHFTVSAGALSAPTEIRIALHRRDGGMLLHFEPHGTVFNRPAQLTISQKCRDAPTNAPTFDIYYRGEPLSQWQFASFLTWSETPEAFQVQIPHFSSYYFIRRQVPSVSRPNAGEAQSQIVPKGKAAPGDSDDDSAASRHQADDRVAQKERPRSK